jgi:oligoribonuclease
MEGVARKQLWLDLETTGLEPDTKHILEAHAVVTDQDLNVVDECGGQVQMSPLFNDEMDDWCSRTHYGSGLIDDCEQFGMPLFDLETRLLEFVNLHFPNSKPSLAGSSVWFDADFVKHHMPRLYAKLHYRVLDVSSLFNALHLTYGYTRPKPSTVALAQTLTARPHRARSDIKESIAMYKLAIELLKRGGT